MKPEAGDLAHKQCPLGGRCHQPGVRRERCSGMCKRMEGATRVRTLQNRRHETTLKKKGSSDESLSLSAWLKHRGPVSQLQYPHSLHIPSSLLTETKRPTQFEVLILPFLCITYRALFARSLTPPSPKAQDPTLSIPTLHALHSALSNAAASTGGRPAGACL